MTGTETGELRLFAEALQFSGHTGFEFGVVHLEGERAFQGINLRLCGFFGLHVFCVFSHFFVYSVFMPEHKGAAGNR